MSLKRRRGSNSQESLSANGSNGNALLIRSFGASSWIDFSSILALVFGGCCANAWGYEQLILTNPRIGTALAFSQMVFITAQSLPSFLAFTPLPRIKPRQAPLLQWAAQVFVLTSGTLLNSWAFAYNIPLTLFIVFRSAGLAVSMLFGYLFLHRRYTAMQITCVFVVSVGVVLATLARPGKPSNVSTSSSDEERSYAIGVAMLVVSLFMTGLLGLLQEKTYRKYGPCWREGVFYTHLLSLPVFLFFIADVKQGISSLSSPAAQTSSLPPWSILVSNLITQLICVSSVNKLTSQVSSVSTNLVLTARKGVSLCFSVWWFGNGWNAQLVVGAAMVFLGSLLFNFAGEKAKKD